MSTHIIIAILVCLGAAALAGAFGRWSKSIDASTEEFMERYARRRAEIAALSLEEARSKVEALLADPEKIKTVPGELPPDMISQLAPSLQSLFKRFESIEPVDSSTLLSRRMITPYRWDWLQGPWQESKFWQIGITLGGDAVLLVKPDQEPIHVHFPRGCCLDDPDATDAELADGLEHPDDLSIYHLLLRGMSD